MKTLFGTHEQQEIRQRLEKIKHDTPGKWGKMNSAQMLAHCAKAMQMPVGDIEVKPSPIRFIGQFFKKRFLGDKPFKRNSPTAPELCVTDKKEFEKEKQNFLQALEKISSGPSVVVRKAHPVFGKMEPHEWGRINYKHLDHHFQQFGV